MNLRQLLDFVFYLSSHKFLNKRVVFKINFCNSGKKYIVNVDRGVQVWEQFWKRFPDNNGDRGRDVCSRCGEWEERGRSVSEKQECLTCFNHLYYTSVALYSQPCILFTNKWAPILPLDFACPTIFYIILPSECTLRSYKMVNNCLLNFFALTHMKAKNVGQKQISK